MQIDSKSENMWPVARAKLRCKTCEDARERVARSSGRHSWISRRVEVGISGGRGQDRVKTFENHVRAPSSCGFQRDIEPPCLHILGCDAQQASHFTGMGSQRQHRRFALVQMIGHTRISVEPVRVQYDWEFGVLDDLANELL